MRVLLVKTSSMGDIIHTFPALTDAQAAIPNIHFDWVIEDSFAELAACHPSVSRIIPVALRRWRKGVFARETRRGWKQLREQLQANQYDVVLDAQGLVKSALVTFFAKGKRIGLGFRSAREWLAAVAYQKRCTVNFYQHAVVRMRSLFSQALDYAFSDEPPNFGLQRSHLIEANNEEKYLVFLHGTTWASKQWPENYWVQLAGLAEAAGLKVKISGGNASEMERANRIAQQSGNVEVVARMTIGSMAKLLVNAQAAVAMDTGFGHLAAALSVPTVSIYGPTNAAYTGALGDKSIHLEVKFPCAPCLNRECTYRKASAVTPACYSTVTPKTVWEKLAGVVE